MCLSYVTYSEDIRELLIQCMYIYIFIYTYTHILYVEIQREREPWEFFLLYVACIVHVPTRSSPTISNHQPFAAWFCCWHQVVPPLATTQQRKFQLAKTSFSFQLWGFRALLVLSWTQCRHWTLTGSNEGSPYKNLCCEHCRDGS